MEKKYKSGQKYYLHDSANLPLRDTRVNAKAISCNICYIRDCSVVVMLFTASRIMKRSRVSNSDTFFRLKEFPGLFFTTPPTPHKNVKQFPSWSSTGANLLFRGDGGLP